jgi:hypothetical protein
MILQQNIFLKPGVKYTCSIKLALRCGCFCGLWLCVQTGLSAAVRDSIRYIKIEANRTV